NSSNLLTSKNFINSTGKTIYTSYKYPTDFASEPYVSMIASHLLSPIIQTTATNNQTPISQTTENYSQPYAQIFVPQNLQLQIAGNVPEIREQVNSFDSYGNPLELQKPYGIKETCVWGANHSRILARVIGAGYNEAIGLVNQVLLNQAGFSYTA